MFGMNARAARQHQESIIRYIDTLPRPEFTPDLWQLEQKKAHLFFIHDDMAQLQPLHDLVRAGSLSGFYPFQYGYTAKKFTFVKKNLGLKSFPIALDLRHDDRDKLPQYMSNEFRIRGEIYAIRPRQIVELDNHRQNGVQFQRIRVNVNIGYRKLMRHSITSSTGNKYSEYHLNKEEMISQEMWMYVGRRDYWMNQLESGFFDFQPIDIIEEDRLWINKYYQYSRVR